MLFAWLLKSFFLRVRHCVVPFLCGLLLLFSANCALTMSDLHYSNPSAEIVYICDKPLDVADGIHLWAFDTMTGRLVTAEDPAEFRYFAAVAADRLFEYDPGAPPSSSLKMPRKYGLTCVKPKSAFPDASPRFFTPSSELFRSNQSCPAKVAESVGRSDPRWLAVVPGAKKSSNPPGQAKKKNPLYVHVCARPSWVKDGVTEWAMLKDVKANRLTDSAKEFAERAENAEAVFILDESAAPETVYWFVTDSATLRCPGKRDPMPYDQVERCKILEMYAQADSMGAALTTTEPNKKGGQTTTTSGSEGKGKGQTAKAATADGKGDGGKTETSSPDGKGPPLSFVEMFSNNLAIAAALASGQSASAKDPNGSRYGMVGGTNVGGVDLLPVQMAVSIFAVVQNPIKNSKDFIERVRRSFDTKKALSILDPNVMTKELAEKLATEPEEKALQDAIAALKRGEELTLESFGKAMAPSLRDAAVIMPYSRAQIFTRGWGGEFQAHHLLEVARAEETLKMGKAAIDDIPAIILSKEQHEWITARLTKAHNELLDEVLRKRGPKALPDKAELWQMYQHVYKEQPSWLQAIEGYFPNVP